MFVRHPFFFMHEDPDMVRQPKFLADLTNLNIHLPNLLVHQQIWFAHQAPMFIDQAPNIARDPSLYPDRFRNLTRSASNPTRRV